MESANATAQGDSGLASPAGTATPTPKRRRWPRRALAITILIFLFAFLFCWFIGVFGGNVRAIRAGRAYRSATLTGRGYTSVTARFAGNDLDSVLRRDHIGTVICLRSGSPSDDWYREELAICRNDNADHRDIPFSARSLPPPEALNALLYTFDHARYPILMHCQAGADRTGLASTLFDALYDNVPLDSAEASQLTWRYSHFPVGRTRAMDDFFALYRRDSQGMDLRTWILTRYPRVYAEQHASTSR